MKELLLLIASTLFKAPRPVRTLRLLFVLVFLCSPLLFAQDRDETTYEAFGGASYLRAIASASGSAFGWHTSITQYPYASHRWIGGTIEGSGLFSTHDVKADDVNLNESLYTCMGGLSFAAPASHRVKPFAHALAGAVVLRSFLTGTGASAYQGLVGASNQTVLGSALGGGLDLPMSHRRLAVRGAADWISFKESASDRINDLRVSIGLVVKF